MFEKFFLNSQISSYPFLWEILYSMLISSVTFIFYILISISEYKRFLLFYGSISSYPKMQEKVFLRIYKTFFQGGFLKKKYKKFFSGKFFEPLGWKVTRIFLKSIRNFVQGRILSLGLESAPGYKKFFSGKIFEDVVEK